MLKIAQSHQCSICGYNFMSRGTNVMYCPACRQKKFHPKKPEETRTCLRCKAEYTTTQPRSKFCGNNCRMYWHIELENEGAELSERSKYELLNAANFRCQGCGADIGLQFHISNGKWTVVCKHCHANQHEEEAACAKVN